MKKFNKFTFHSFILALSISCVPMVVDKANKKEGLKFDDTASPTANRNSAGGKVTILPSEAGKNLYQVNCASCHMPLENSLKKNKTAAQIQNAIYNNAVMKAIKGLKNLTPSEVDAMALR